MSKKTLSSSLVVIATLPGLVYVLTNFYVWIFDGWHPIRSKFWAAMIPAAICVGFIFEYIWVGDESAPTPVNSKGKEK